MPIGRLCPVFDRHQLAMADGEAIRLRWENEMKQVVDELQAIFKTSVR